MNSGGYRDLEIYRMAHALAVRIHLFSLKLPKHELYEIGSQIRRSSKSVSVNIVEGYGRRRYKAEYLKFLTYSQASCDETMEWLIYIDDIYQEQHRTAEGFKEEIDLLGRKLNKYIEAVERR